MEVLSLEDAVVLATRAHDGQFDKGSGAPYITHPLRVMKALGRYGAKVQRVAVLHDIVEDTDVTFDDLRQAGLPEDEVAAVDSVTKRSGETKAEAIARAKNDPIGKLVKLADNRDNANPERLKLLAEPQRSQFAQQYEKRLQILVDGDEWLAAQKPVIQELVWKIFQTESIA